MNNYNGHLPEYFKRIENNLYSLIKWLVVAAMIGLLVGACGTLFAKAMNLATSFRTSHDVMLYFLPIAGLVIVWLYRVSGEYNNTGTNLILSAIQSGNHISLKVAPLIFISTVLTHLCGGSSGREGAALQLGGSIGESLGTLFNFDDSDKHIAIMCAMSACFSAVFGTPIAAAIFSMEVVSIGILHYSALIPCVTSSFIAFMVAQFFGGVPETFDVSIVPVLTPITMLQTVILGVFLAGISVVFCVSLHVSEHVYKHFFKNPYIRVVVGGFIVIALTLILGTRDYLGAGMPMIEACFETGVPFYAFALKILFTAVTLGAGFKGGEIVPSFFIGATLGFVIGPIFGLPTQLATACGMVGVFCGVTNSPITSLLIALEMFGYDGVSYYVIAIAISYTLSGYYGLYTSQKIVYSKHKTKFINKNTQ